MEAKAEWELLMNDEIVENQTWELVKLLESKCALHNKWVYELKEKNDGTRTYKARLVVRGFQ